MVSGESALFFDDPCILFALGREAKAFLRQFRTQERFPQAPCRARFCGPEWLTVLVVETGIGSEHTEKALEWVLSKPFLGNVPYCPKVVIAAGFSGALRADMQIGDVILATEVSDLEGKRRPATWPEKLPAGEWRPVLHRGRLLTVSTFITNPEEKRALGEKHEALAVDMETAVVARICATKGVPFGCVRAISDDMHTALSPELANLFADGNVSVRNVARAVIGQPKLIRELLLLARNSRQAGRQLATALGELLTLTLPWSADPGT